MQLERDSILRGEGGEENCITVFSSYLSCWTNCVVEYWGCIVAKNLLHLFVAWSVFSQFILFSRCTILQTQSPVLTMRDYVIADNFQWYMIKHLWQIAMFFFPSPIPLTPCYVLLLPCLLYPVSTYPPPPILPLPAPTGLQVTCLQ